MSGHVITERPQPGTPRPYEFPAVERIRLDNGFSLVLVDLPGRPLISATLVIRRGAVDEPADQGGATVLAARALSEGTEQYDAVGLTVAAERLGASIGAQAGWDATTVSIDVPGARLAPALDLLVEMVRRPTFPEREVERLREERLSDLLQVRADPRRRTDEAFVETIYVPEAPYHRPSGGRTDTVAGLDPDVLRATHARNLQPAGLTLALGGELGDLDVAGIVADRFGDWANGAELAEAAPIVDAARQDDRVVRVIHRPGSVQTEFRIGHPGLPRRIPDFHAVSVMSAILGGLFNSRLNSNLREEKGYTYGAWAGFDLRRGAGPFLARAAVNTEVTVAAVRETLRELERMQATDVSDAELRAARDFLVGVFPLRFETPESVVGALAGLVVHDLPDDELARYRPAIEAVTVADVRRAAEEHIELARSAIVMVGDADAFGAELEAAGVGPVSIEREEPAGPPDG
jgi:zinc protease